MFCYCDWVLCSSYSGTVVVQKWPNTSMNHSKFAWTCHMLAMLCCYEQLLGFLLVLLCSFDTQTCNIFCLHFLFVICLVSTRVHSIWGHLMLCHRFILQLRIIIHGFWLLGLIMLYNIPSIRHQVILSIHKMQGIWWIFVSVNHWFSLRSCTNHRFFVTLPQLCRILK